MRFYSKLYLNLHVTKKKQHKYKTEQHAFDDELMIIDLCE